MTMRGLLALTARPMRPVCVGNPSVSFFQLAPPLLLLKIPPTSSPPVAPGRDGGPGIARGVAGLRGCRIQDDIATAGPRVMRRRCLQNKFPVLAGVSRFEETALAAIGPEMTAHRDVRHLRFRWMNDNAPNGATLLQSDVLPIFAAIGRTINAVPPAGGVTIVRFARSHPDHSGIGRRNGAVSDREHGLLVENRIE